MDNNDKSDTNNVHFLQLQIDALTENYKKLLEKHHCENIRYKQIITELDNLYLIFEDHDDKVEKISDCIKNGISTANYGRMVYTDTSKIHNLIIDADIEMLFLTIVAGGGAGGIGFVKDMYYFSGGGGGAGACYIKKPIKASKNTLLKIKVGKGGYLKGCHKSEHGEDSFVEIFHPQLSCTSCTSCTSSDSYSNTIHCCDCHNQRCELILTKGGKNAHPNNNQVSCYLNNNNDIDMCCVEISGGKGGVNDFKCFDGDDGGDGCVSVPSQFAASGGNGGCSCIYEGGCGGGNYFNNGGAGGNYLSSSDRSGCMIIGSDGKFGSGGGGSAPKINIDFKKKLSGYGGDGIVIIEWC